MLVLRVYRRVVRFELTLRAKGRASRMRTFQVEGRKASRRHWTCLYGDEFQQPYDSVAMRKGEEEKHGDLIVLHTSVRIARPDKIAQK